MFSFLKRRAFVLLIGFLLIALFIWFAGPYFAFGSYRPLESDALAADRDRARRRAVGRVGGAETAARAAAPSDQLVAAVISISRPRRTGRPPKRQNCANGSKRPSPTLTAQRDAGSSLYDLPWYVFIGAPGSGKTTALVNSGLEIPAGAAGRQRRACAAWAARAIATGGLPTKRCFSTPQAATRPRIRTRASDSEGWKEFLALLAKYRKRRPLNGVVLTISAQDLLTQGDAGREAHVEAARRRLNEFTRELRIQLPVYVMVTKCDMVAGFTEYFDDLTQEGRAQVWGVTFPYEQTLNGGAADSVSARSSTR